MITPITRGISPDLAQELLKRAPRACISFACDHCAHAQPVALASPDRRFLVGLPQDAQCLPVPGQEVVLLVDEGIHFFDLRAVSIRGRAQPAAAPPGLLADLRWFEVIPERIGGWDFGALRQISDDN